jgi:hypothetical protein
LLLGEALPKQGKKKKDTPSISGSILSNLFNKILLVQSHHVIYRLQRYDKNLKHPNVSRKIAKSGQNQRLRTLGNRSKTPDLTPGVLMTAAFFAES